MILYKEGETQAQIDEANSIIEALDSAYPGHPWAVRVYGDSGGGGFFIRHLDFPSNWGMNCRHRTKTYSASALKKEVIRMAGEWLERAGLQRGKWTEEPIKRLEGVPEKYQPIRPDKNISTVINTDFTPLREEARPQVHKLGLA